MAAYSFKADAFAAQLAPRSEDTAQDQALLRAYSLERSVDYGCSLEDALKLRRRVEAGHGWVGVALQLADDNEHRAAHALERGQDALAARYQAYGAACCRLAQAGLEHDVPRRLQAYERQARLFRAAASSPSQGGGESLDVEHHGLPHAAWLFPAPRPAAGRPAVVVWGGADGWCEAFHPSVPFYTERGLAVCLLELPGQGYARLRHGSVLRPDFTELVSATLDALARRGFAPERFGVVGHSLGGALALAAAAADSRIRACCSNGGSAQQRGLTKYPRVQQRIGRMMGDATSETEVLAFFEEVDLPAATRRMRASLLCLHGGQDTLVDEDEAQQLIELRGAAHGTLELWSEGVHCIYNHAIERNSVLADWFAAQLAD